MIADKINELPAARDLCVRLDLDNRVVSLDALHTQADIARPLGLAHGADSFSPSRAASPPCCQYRAPRRHPAGGFCLAFPHPPSPHENLIPTAWTQCNLRLTHVRKV